MRTISPAFESIPPIDSWLFTASNQFEESEFITVVEREFKIRKIRRQKYMRECQCDAPRIITAPGPLKVVPKGRYDLPFAVSVAVAKYFDHLPLERQAAQMLRDGLAIVPHVLWDQVYHLHRHLLPTYEAIYASAFDERALGADETGWPMLEKGRKLWQVRCLTSERLSYFSIVTRKDTESALDLLTHPTKGIFRGVLVTDGAKAYEAARRESENAFDLQGCWCHARRKFLEAEPNYPSAAGVLDLIDELFDVEREAEAMVNVPLEVARAHLRSEKSAGIVGQILEWLNTSVTGCDGSDLNKAIRYTHNQWAKLRLFIARPEAPIHNNSSEFALRKPVQGRKAFYGAKSLAGTQVAAVFYTVLETTRKAGLNPTAFLHLAAERAIRSPGTATLPWEASRLLAAEGVSTVVEGYSTAPAAPLELTMVASSTAGLPAAPAAPAEPTTVGSSTAGLSAALVVEPSEPTTAPLIGLLVIGLFVLFSVLLESPTAPLTFGALVVAGPPAATSDLLDPLDPLESPTAPLTFGALMAGPPAATSDLLDPLESPTAPLTFGAPIVVSRVR